MIRKFLILLVIGLVFQLPVSEAVEGKVNDASIIHVGDQAGRSPSARPQLQPTRSGGSTSSGGRPTVGSPRELATPEASQPQTLISTSQLARTERYQTDGTHSSPVRQLTQGPVHQQRVIYRPPASVRPANYQLHPGTSSALPHQYPQSQAGVGAAHYQQGPSAVPLHASPNNQFGVRPAMNQQGYHIPASVSHQVPPAIPGRQVVSVRPGMQLGIESGQTGPVTYQQGAVQHAVSHQVPPAIPGRQVISVRPGMPLGIESGQTGPVSYQQGAIQYAGHSQPFPAGSVGQSSLVPHYRQPVAGHPAAPVQNSPITSSRAGPPAHPNDPRTIQHGQINDPPTQPSVSYQPAVSDRPSAPPSCESQPVYRQRRSPHPVVPQLPHAPSVETQTMHNIGGAAQQAQTHSQTNSKKAIVVSEDGQMFRINIKRPVQHQREPTASHGKAPITNPAQTFHNPNYVPLNLQSNLASLYPPSSQELYHRLSSMMNSPAGVQTEILPGGCIPHQGQEAQSINHFNQAPNDFSNVDMRNPHGQIQPNPILPGDPNLNNQLGSSHSPSPLTNTFTPANPHPSTQNNNQVFASSSNTQNVAQGSHQMVQGRPNIYPTRDPSGYHQGATSNSHAIFYSIQHPQGAGPQPGRGNAFCNIQHQSEALKSGLSQHNPENLPSREDNIPPSGTFQEDEVLKQDNFAVYQEILEIINEGPPTLGATIPYYRRNTADELKNVVPSEQAFPYPLRFEDGIVKWHEEYRKAFLDQQGQSSNTGGFPKPKILSYVNGNFLYDMRMLRTASPELYLDLQNQYRKIVHRRVFFDKQNKGHPSSQPQKYSSFNQLNHSSAQPQTSLKDDTPEISSRILRNIQSSPKQKHTNSHPYSDETSASFASDKSQSSKTPGQPAETPSIFQQGNHEETDSDPRDVAVGKKRKVLEIDD